MVAAAPTDKRRVLPSGYMLVGAGEPQLAGVFRLIEHGGATIEAAGSRRIVTFPSPAWVTWLAWYSPRIVQNGWEPYDQPHPCAYLPIGYRSLMRFPTTDGGLLLRQVGRERATRLMLSTENVVVLEASERAVPNQIRGLLDDLGAQLDSGDRGTNFLAALNSDESALPNRV